MLTPLACSSISEIFAGAWVMNATGIASELHDLLRQVQNPNVHGLDKELTHRVEQFDEIADPEGWPEMFRSLSLNCSGTLARAAFDAACKCYPNRRLVLKWGALVIERYEPPRKATND